MDQIIQCQKWVGVWTKSMRTNSIPVAECPRVSMSRSPLRQKINSPSDSKSKQNQLIWKNIEMESRHFRQHQITSQRWKIRKTENIRDQTWNRVDSIGQAIKHSSSMSWWAVGTGTKSSTWDGNYCTLYGYNSIIARSWIQFFARLCVVHLFH